MNYDLSMHNGRGWSSVIRLRAFNKAADSKMAGRLKFSFFPMARRRFVCVLCCFFGRSEIVDGWRIYNGV